MGRGGRPHKPASEGPRIYQRGRYWQVDLRPWGGVRTTMRNPQDPGWPMRGERTEWEEVAREWQWAYLRLVKGEHRRRVFKLGPEPMGLGAAVEKYLAHRSATVERSTVSGDRTALMHLKEHIKADRLTDRIEDWELQDMFDALTERGYRATTLATYLKAVGVFFTWLGPYNPTYEVVLPDPGEVDVFSWTDDEVAKLRAAADKVDRQATTWPSARLALEVGLNMGLRQGEIFALSREAVSSRDRTTRVQYQVPKDGTVLKPLKGKKARTAHILPDWWEHHQPGIGIMLTRQDGHLMLTRSQRNMITRILDTAGLNAVGAGWHSLRHTYARLYIEKYDGRLQELQLSMGHAKLNTTEKCYGHFRQESAAELFARRAYGE